MAIVEAAATHGYPQQPQTLAEGIRSLRKSASLCDIFLTVGDVEFPAHQAMLVAVSPAFATLIAPVPTPQQQPEAENGAAKVDTVMNDAVPEQPAEVAATSSAPPEDGIPKADTMTNGAVSEQLSEAAASASAPSEDGAPKADIVMNDAKQDQGEQSSVAEKVEATGTEVLASAEKAESESKVRSRLKVPMSGVKHAESIQILLDYVYQVGTGAAWEYRPSCLEVNTEILKLSHSLALTHLHEHAARWLTVGLTTKNLVQRLVICEEFNLHTLHEKLIQSLVAHPVQLSIVCRSVEILAHPKILQTLLVQVNTHIFTAGQQAQASADTVEKAAEPNQEKVEKPVKHEKDKLEGSEVAEAKEQHPKAVAKKVEKFKEEPVEDEVDADAEEAVKKKPGPGRGKKTLSDAARSAADAVSEKPLKKKKTA